MTLPSSKTPFVMHELNSTEPRETSSCKIKLDRSEPRDASFCKIKIKFFTMNPCKIHAEINNYQMPKTFSTSHKGFNTCPVFYKNKCMLLVSQSTFVGSTIIVKEFQGGVVTKKKNVSLRSIWREIVGRIS